MNQKDKESLIIEWKKLRGEYFNLYNEDMQKFSKKYSNHPLFESVCKHFDKSFRDVNEVAQNEVEGYLK